VQHLQACDENFLPPLSKKIDIPTYATKIIKNAVTFEAWHNETLVGLVAAYFNDQQNSNGFITNVSTLKSFFGRGIASQLLIQCTNYAKENDFACVLLEVAANNSAAYSLYIKHKFIVVSTTHDLVTMKLKI
jgi:ribosomal protein S18 acetylase RimI-like enzyme